MEDIFTDADGTTWHRLTSADLAEFKECAEAEEVEEVEENVIELRQVRGNDPKPKVEPATKIEADVIEFRKPKSSAAPATPAAPVTPTEGEALCPHCWTLNTIEAAVTSAVATGVDPEEILDRVYTVLGELGCLPPPPVAGRGT